MPSSLIPARSGAYSRLRTGQKIKIISTYGEQVVDTWAFAANNSSTYLSMSHTRAFLLKLNPGVGEVLSVTLGSQCSRLLRTPLPESTIPYSLPATSTDTNNLVYRAIMIAAPTIFTARLPRLA
ncbi:MAG: hypothetical protein M1830_009242 [Pleopsidium flavum]|nr:MAG: hypothetical protein M1830_009242 [Pleopsidium flavum]